MGRIRDKKGYQLDVRGDLETRVGQKNSPSVKGGEETEGGLRHSWGPPSAVQVEFLRGETKCGDVMSSAGRPELVEKWGSSCRQSEQGAMEYGKQEVTGKSCNAQKKKMERFGELTGVSLPRGRRWGLDGTYKGPREESGIKHLWVRGVRINHTLCSNIAGLAGQL